LEVPAQVVPAPAAQSFLPFIATPKHFSLSMFWSAFWARAGAAASVRAAPSARASVAAVEVVSVWDIENSLSGGCEGRMPRQASPLYSSRTR